MSKVWLVGENNPYSADPHHALYPWPAGCSGHRFCFSILKMAEDEYLASFERRNLLHADRWSAPAARKAASALRAGFEDGDAVVLLGAKVAEAFGLPFAPGTVTPQLHGSVRVRYLVSPHPSGLSRQWNDPTMRAAVRDAVRALLADRVSDPAVERPLTRQTRELENARDVLDRGLDAYMPSDIGGHAACMALVRAGLLDVVDGVRHEETGREGRGYALVSVDRASADEHGAPVDRDLRAGEFDERGGEPQGDGG